jgi:hypothetical protein
MKKGKHHKTTIHHHGDGSHTSTRHYKHDDGTESEEGQGHADLDGVHDMLEDHQGSPNVGEAAAPPAEAPAPAAAPAAAAPVPGM